MTSEEIEHLLVEYMNGEISGPNKELLENLFRDDERIRLEANEFISVWQSLDNIPFSKHSEELMDTTFYDMLKKEEGQLKKTGAIHFLSKNKWMSIAACLILGLFIFFLGRFTSQKNTAALSYDAGKAAPDADNAINKFVQGSKPSNSSFKNSYARLNSDNIDKRLSSVYASERIVAIWAMVNSAQLNHAELVRLEMILKEDPNPAVRLTVVEAISPFIKKEDVQNVLIDGLENQTDELIQTTIADVLINGHVKKAVPYLVNFSNHKGINEDARNKIELRIESL
jgi:hypothetical protein